MTPTLLQTDLGPLWYPAGDGGVTSIVEDTGSWEPQEAEAIKNFLNPGDTFVDVGAHVGYFSVLAAQIVGEEGSVLAFEPVEENATLLFRNLEQFTNCVVLQSAAWVENGHINMYRNSVNSGDNRSYDHRESLEPVLVPATTIDSLHLSRVDVMKIDTQGSDHMVILGALKTLEKFRPTLIVEWWPEGIRDGHGSPEKVLDLYERLGYRVSALTITPQEIPTDGYCSLLMEAQDV